jgi:hypothetical protein
MRVFQEIGSEDKYNWWVCGEMSLIKVGLETNRAYLRSELLAHPCMYFAILIIGDRAALCIRTCDNRGEDLQSHIVDGLAADSDGNLVSIFEEELWASIDEQRRSNMSSDSEEFCQISSAMADKIRSLPGLVDYIISSILNKDRNIVIHPISWTSYSIL